MFTVCALYQFVRLDDFEAFRTPLRELMVELEVKGTILLALEGLNGTISGSKESIDGVIQFLQD
jgi:Predicted sulfurtransferase